MKSPFDFGNVVKHRGFINRKEELVRLQSNFESLNNTIILSPRRWGKTSLVYKSTDNYLKSHKSHRVCHINMQKVRTEKAFYEAYTKAVLQATTSKTTEIMNTVKAYLSRIKPSVSFSTGSQSTFDISLQWDDIHKKSHEILDLPEHIATKKKLKIIVCIDEFQDLSGFKSPQDFQQNLRAAWQHHHNVAYCLYGSHQHLMSAIFENRDQPFFKFGDIIHLAKIEEQHWIPYIIRSFSRTGKKIHKEHARQITQWMDNHPFYVQYFSHLIWLHTSSEVTDGILKETLNELIDQFAMQYDKLTAQLSQKQKNLIEALIKGGDKLSSKESLKKFDLGTSATVIKSRQALVDKEILEFDKDGIYFQDPPYRLWLERRYFAED